MRWCAALAVLGLGLFVFAPAPWLAYVALAIWGSAPRWASRWACPPRPTIPSRPLPRLLVSTIGYGAFLCGPPLLGLLAEHVGILHSLLAVMVMLIVSFLLSPVARKLPVPARAG